MSNQIILKITYDNGSVHRYLPAMHPDIFIEKQIAHPHSFIPSMIESGKKSVSIEMVNDNAESYKLIIFLEKIIDIQIYLAEGSHLTEKYSTELSLKKLPGSEKNSGK